MKKCNFSEHSFIIGKIMTLGIYSVCNVFNSVTGFKNTLSLLFTQNCCKYFGHWKAGLQHFSFFLALFDRIIFPFALTYFWLPWWLTWLRSFKQRRRPRLDRWVRKIPWRREWVSTPGFLPEKWHGPRSLVIYTPWSRKESDTTERLTLYFLKELS